MAGVSGGGMSVGEVTVWVMDDAPPDPDEDRRDIELCEAVKALNEPGVPHDVFMSSLDAA
jgi:hypothetical protein